jgi:uncharacterized OB-fold protein
MTTKTDAPVSIPVPDLESDDLLGEFPDGPRLVGTRCSDCGRAMIGARFVCSSCVSRDVERIALPTIGVLYSFTRLHIGETIRPLGYVDLDVDLDVGVRTLADLREDDVMLTPGMRVSFGVDGADWYFTPVIGD